jgi:hypothetical protein
MKATSYLLLVATFFSVANGQRLGSTDSFYETRICGKYNCTLQGYEDSQDPKTSYLRTYYYSTSTKGIYFYATRDMRNKSLIEIYVTGNVGDAYEPFAQLVRAAVPGATFTTQHAVACVLAGDISGKHTDVYDRFKINCQSDAYFNGSLTVKLRSSH